MSEPIVTTDGTAYVASAPSVPAKSALLSLEEFLEIRERRSQDDLKALIAHVEELFGIAPPAPVIVPVVLSQEPQTTVVVAPDTAPPAIPEDDPSATQPAAVEPLAVEPVPPADPNAVV